MIYGTKEAIRLSGPNLISPLLDGFVMGPPISSHHGIRCCPAMRHNSDNKYIVKIVSVPASQSQLDALLLTGAYKDPGEAVDYFKALADDLAAEADLLSKLSTGEGFLPYSGHQTVPMGDNRLGYLVYMVTSYKRSLDKYMRRDTAGALNDAIKLGLDMCTALSYCRDNGYIYIALKPTNIFLSEDKEFRIGDIGFLPLESVTNATLPSRYRSPYCTPEILDPMQTLNETVDTYALGMILYQICNEGKLPTMPDEANQPLPMPKNGDQKLHDVIMKAISSDINDRFSDPAEMKEALAQCIHDDVRIYSPGASPVSAGSDTQVFSPDAVNNALTSTESDTKIIPTAQVRKAVLSGQETAISSDTRVVPTDAVRDAIRIKEAAPSAAAKDAASVPDTASNITNLSGAQGSGSIPQETKILTPVGAAPVASGTKSPNVRNTSKQTPPVEYHQEEDDEEDDEDEIIRVVTREPRRVRKPLGKGWIVWLLVLILLGGIGYGAYYYYTNYYVQTIDSISISGEHDHLTVYVATQTDPSLLTVTCSDTYGNSMKSVLVDGQAEFRGLLPSSQYKISVEIEGFHQLKGKTSTVFNTETRTEIVSFTGIAGSEDGSVMLTFTVNGPEPEKWILTWSAEGEETLTEEFTGHSITVRDLAFPKVYTFTLTPSEEMFVTGQTSMEFSSTALIMARDLAITSCYDGEMTVQWEAPSDVSVDSWTVRCYSDGGYDQTVVTSVCSAVFLQLDPSFVYYVEVTADGMTQPARTSITADPITITDLKVDLSDPENMTITWDHIGDAPDGGWLLMYSLDGTNTQSVVKCSGPSAEISPRIHGAEYTLVIQAADSTSIFENEHIYQCPEADVYKDHSFDASRTTAYLLVTPEKENWTGADVKKTDYTDSFRIGDKISILLFCDNRFYIPSDEISILYVIRDSSGSVVGTLVSQATDDWHDMWVAHNTNYAELGLPVTPSETGDYTLSIYFNGSFAASAEFSVTE